MAKKTIIVLGMHRSGTSVVSGILAHLGVEMNGSEAPYVSNVRGHFEDQDFIAFNERILNKHQSSWENPPQDDTEISPNLLKEAQTLIKRKEKDMWGWKDLRTVLTLDYYLPGLKNPFFIFVSREKKDVAKSLKRRNGLTKEKSFDLINQYEKHLERAKVKTSEYPQLFISMEAIKKDPVKEVTRMADFLGIPLSEIQKKEIQSFILPTPKLRLLQAKLKIKKAIKFLLNFLDKNLLRP